MIQLIDGENHGIEIINPPEEKNVFCCLSLSKSHVSVDELVIHIWTTNKSSKYEYDLWSAWINISEYKTLLQHLDNLTFESYDNVNQTDIAYTPCTSTCSSCFVCGEVLEYREDPVVSLTRANGPIYCHQNCVQRFFEVIKSIDENHLSTITSQIV